MLSDPWGKYSKNLFKAECILCHMSAPMGKHIAHKPGYGMLYHFIRNAILEARIGLQSASDHYW